MARELVVAGIRCTSPTFQRGLQRLDPAIQGQVKTRIRSLLFADLAVLPGKFHAHTLTNKKVPSAVKGGQMVNVWTIHVTSDDSYKASFTFEGGVAYFRICDRHDIVDKNP